jgi:hypothetical protein
MAVGARADSHDTHTLIPTQTSIHTCTHIRVITLSALQDKWYELAGLKFSDVMYGRGHRLVTKVVARWQWVRHAPAPRHRVISSFTVQQCCLPLRWGRAWSLVTINLLLWCYWSGIDHLHQKHKSKDAGCKRVKQGFQSELRI